MAPECPESHHEAMPQEGFFGDGLHVRWDAHHIGWAAAGVATGVASGLSVWNVAMHCSHYSKPLEQRQVVRILLMPAVYSVVSFFSYRYYVHYVYYAVIRDIYEAFVLAAFLILCLLYVGRSPLEQRQVMAQKEKLPLVFPLCCFRYRPSKAYFLVATKWSVMQYVILRPLIAAAAIVTDAMGIFCGSSYNLAFANVWLLIITFICATTALYGLLIIYHLAKEDLNGHRPMAKFMSIKIAVFLVFYQGFLLSFLDHLGYIHETENWSKANIADGINALATTIEMALVAAFQLHAFPSSEYKAIIKGSEAPGSRSPWKNFLHSQDYRDFGRDIVVSLKYFFNTLKGRTYSHIGRNSHRQETNDLDFGAAFGLRESHNRIHAVDESFDQQRQLGDRKFKALSGMKQLDDHENKSCNHLGEEHQPGWYDGCWISSPESTLYGGQKTENDNKYDIPMGQMVPKSSSGGGGADERLMDSNCNTL